MFWYLILIFLTFPSRMLPRRCFHHNNLWMQVPQFVILVSVIPPLWKFASSKIKTICFTWIITDSGTCLRCLVVYKKEKYQTELTVNFETSNLLKDSHCDNKRYSLDYQKTSFISKTLNCFNIDNTECGFCLQSFFNWILRIVGWTGKYWSAISASVSNVRWVCQKSIFSANTIIYTPPFK